ncbi:hypothetical protein [Magnetospirillum sp. UT-4]|uniref:hypothetical protein n=1 Tax=Magnetospirillum sp. UT-4 TaxID=2681467 RepID=UPI0013842E61|nr:hypothetical protein [Magnetospirillum sp. UT-4]CAA7623931.1 exported hypothetical protein [Magnetospirillum sp. UT-4]
MRETIALAAILLCAAGTAPAGELELGGAMPVTELEGSRGGTDSGGDIVGSLLQNNEANQTAGNTGNISVSQGAAKSNGTIHAAQVNGNHGITAVMQNTGDMVNMNNATSVNVYMR